MPESTLQRPEIIQTGKGTIQQALELFDSLDCVDTSFMIGRWHGKEIATGHPQDGILTATRWYGKEFEDAETVHPLLHKTGSGKLFRVRPRPTLVYLGLKLPILKSKPFRPVSLLTTRLLKTNQSQARIRMIEYRDKVSATMVYDFLPINDHFRKLDDDTALGMMDFKGLENPYPFVLYRDR